MTRIRDIALALLALAFPTLAFATLAHPTLAAMPTRVSVLDWGADPSGAADSTRPIQDGIDRLCASGTGGEIDLPGTFRITATLVVRCGNVMLQGLGHGMLHQNLEWDAASRLIWAGAKGGTLLAIAPLPDPIQGRAIIGGGVQDILLDCNGVAATCLYVGSVRLGRFRIAYNNPQAGTALTAGVVFDTVDLSEYNDTQHNDIDIEGAELGGGGRGVLLQAKARASRSNGAAYFGNTSYNVFHRLALHYWRGTPLTLRESDNNIFEVWGMNAPPAIPPQDPIPAYATTYAIELEPSMASDSVHFNPSNNVFFQGGAAGAIRARGTEVAGAAGASGELGGVPYPNLFLRLDKGNGVPDPVVGTGAYVYFGDSGWNDQGLGIYNGVFSSSRAGTVATRAASGNAGGAVFHAEALRPTATAPKVELPAIRLQSDNHAAQWSLYALDNGSLRITPNSGPDHGLNLDADLSVAGDARIGGHIVQTLVAAPADAHARCSTGQSADDAQFHYVCVATDSWKRVALSGW